MAEAVVSFVLERLGDFLIEEARFLHGVGGQVRGIRDELCWMKAFLKDADSRQHEDERIRVWVADVRTLAYDAGDVLESFLLGVGSKKQGGIKRVLKRYVCILNECVVLHKTGSKIQGIKARISDLKSRLETYGIRSLSKGSSTSANERQSQLRRTYSHVGQDDFVGLEGDVEDLVAHLVSDHQDSEKYYQVVSICGMGGLGKTTLAQKIYNHPKVKRHFAAFAWVCISQQWQTKEVLQQVLIKLLPEQRDQIVKLKEEELMKKLFIVQNDKSCLVVLDDIWSQDAWDSLKPAFGRKRNSKLLLTSRNTEVAMHVDPKGLLFEPRILSEGECWELLKKKAFTIRDQRAMEDAEKMEKLGKEMVGHCRGLPLAVVVLGGILVTKQSLTEWERVRRSVKSYITSGDRNQHGGVLDILALSYNELPYQLKPCFLYLGKFIEDSEIKTERLYQMWDAESMVRSEDQREGETMMDVAECYLAELAQRCMVQVSIRRKERRRTRFKSCRLHDLMRDLCLSKAKEEDFFHVIDFRQQNDHELAKNSSSLLSTNNSTRRLVIHFDSESFGSTHSLHVKDSSKHLRSLFLTNYSYEFKLPMFRIANSYLKDFKLLKVLAIEGLGGRLDADDEVSYIDIAKVVLDCFKLEKLIGDLVYLRYLSLRGTELLTFPSITNLKQLQTLDLRGEIGFILPCMENVLGKMGSLQHLYLPQRRPKSLREVKLQLAGLSKLETLININSSWCEIEDLFELNNLRKLSAIVCSSNARGAERMVDYVTSLDQNHLQYSDLKFGFFYPCDDKWNDIALLLGCANIHKLCMYGSIGTILPRPNNDHHFNFSPSLTKLILAYSELNEDPMPTLENVPNLRILSLHDRAYVGKEIICSATGFPQLREILLRGLPNLEKWGIHEGAMPNLASLTVRDCTKLKELPDGLRFITTLKELEIISMPMEFKERLCVKDGEEGEDFQKIQHVPSISIE